MGEAVFGDPLEPAVSLRLTPGQLWALLNPLQCIGPRCKPLSRSAEADISIHRGFFFFLLFCFVFKYHFAHEPQLNNCDPPRISAVQIPSLGEVTISCVPCGLRIMQTKAQYVKTHLSILICMDFFKNKKSRDSL